MNMSFVSHIGRRTLSALITSIISSAALGSPCIVANSGGTTGLPPPRCEYTSLDDDMRIIDGLVGAAIEIDGVLHSFANIVKAAVGNLGGQTHKSTMRSFSPLLTGMGALAGLK